jgi:hypothetical protein
MSTAHDDIREQLQQVVAVIRPYAQSVGPYHDIADVRSAITLAQHLLERAQELARKTPSPP